MRKPAILVARAVFPDVLTKLESHFDVTANQGDEIFNAEQLRAHLKGKVWK